METNKKLFSDKNVPKTLQRPSEMCLEHKRGNGWLRDDDIINKMATQADSEEHVYGSRNVALSSSYIDVVVVVGVLYFVADFLNVAADFLNVAAELISVVVEIISVVFDT